MSKKRQEALPSDDEPANDEGGRQIRSFSFRLRGRWAVELDGLVARVSDHFGFDISIADMVAMALQALSERMDREEAVKLALELADSAGLAEQVNAHRTALGLPTLLDNNLIPLEPIPKRK